jgi:hypothetical protein
MKRDGTAPTAVQGILNDIKTNAQNGSRRWDEDYITENTNSLERLLRLPNDRANIMNERFAGMNYSFLEALGGKDPDLQEQIYDILDEMGGIDIDGIAGKEDRATYATPENGYRLQRAIMESADGKEIIAITEAQMHEFAGNMLQVQGAFDKKYLVMSARAHKSLNQDQLSKIEKHCEILSSDLDVIETCGGGSARCMMAEVFLPKA